jgi:hypothetical protein
MRILFAAATFPDRLTSIHLKIGYRNYNLSAIPTTTTTTQLPVICNKCRATPERLTQKKYCRRDYAVKIQIVNRETDAEWEKYLLKVEEIVKRRGTGIYHIRYGKIHYWVPKKDVACGCPAFKIGSSYLLMGRETVVDPQRSGLIFNRHSLIMPWTQDVASKVGRFARRELHGFCPIRRKSTKMQEDLM